MRNIPKIIIIAEKQKRRPPIMVKSVFVLNAYNVNASTTPSVIRAAINTILDPSSPFVYFTAEQTPLTK